MKYLSWIAIVLSIGAIVLVLVKKTDRVGYINWVQIFNEFEMKKELETDFKFQTSRSQSTLDSLKIAFESSNRRWENDTTNKILFDSLKMHWRLISELERVHSERTESLTSTYDQQIQIQLAQYLREFGESEGLDLVLGIMEDHEVIYASSKTDLTRKAIKFVNDKYNDKE